MTIIQKKSEVPYSPTQMYELVDDIEAYSSFVPWCTKSTVFLRTIDEVRARLEFNKNGITQSFSTLNKLQKNKRIDLFLLDGPFRQLEGFWSFEPAAQGCLIHFYLEFVFANRFLDMAAGPLFQNITHNFIDAFTDRALELYGDPKNSKE